MRKTYNSPASHPPLSIEVVERAVSVLEFMAASDKPLSLQAIAPALGIAKSSVYRLLLTWEHLGYLERVGPAGHFRLGIRALELGRKMGSRTRLAELVQTQLTRLHERFRESVYLGLYRGGKVVLVDAIQSTQPVRVVVDLGETCFLHASAQGKCVAAYLQPERLWSLLEEVGIPQLTGKTNTDPKGLIEDLVRIRANGYAVNWEETIEGCVCVGAPFFSGTDGAVLGSIGISTPISRVNENLLASMAEEIKHISEEITTRLRDLVAEPECLTRQQANQTDLNCNLLPSSSTIHSFLKLH
jgi:DNA-binding IclR family transcriptional regulator